MAWVGTHFSTAALIGLLVLVNLSLNFRMFSVGVDPQEAINVAILMITLGFVGIMTMSSARRSRANQRLLRAQSSRITYALRRVTEQKARNRRVLDSLDIGVARVDESGMIESANRVFRALYAIEESGTSRPTSAVEYRARRGAPVPQNETTIARASRGELFNDSVVWLFGLDGQWRALNTSTRLLEEGAGADDGILLVVEDVTTKVDPRADKKETRRTISHELRNPLTAIIGHVDLLLERDDVSDAARRQIEVVERAGERMQRLISSALSTASDPSEDADVDFDLAEIARASVEGFAPAAEAAEVALKVELDEPLPATEMRSDFDRSSTT